MTIGIDKPLTLCLHLEVVSTKHPAVWVCKECGEEFVTKMHWDMMYIRANELLLETQHWASLGHQYHMGGEIFYNKVRALLKRDKQMKVYIAGGWFSEEQEQAILEIEGALRGKTIFDVYSPRNEMLYVPGADIDPGEVLKTNILSIESANFVLASTEGKDMGTLFECGYAYSIGIPIVYYYKHDGKFNLMLSGSAHAVLQSYTELQDYLTEVNKTNRLHGVTYEGEVE